MKRLLFIEIVGHAMRGLAYAAKQQGNIVTGLDPLAEDGPGTEWLDAHDLPWTRTPDVKLLDGIDTVIISGATPADDMMIVEARRRGIPILSFAEYLGELTKDQRVISVAGTHGKTTTSSLITWLFESAGRNPDYLIGIQPFNFQSSARLTGSDIVVIEGDEYRASNLDDRSKVQLYHPDVLVLTSAEMDHPDLFRDFSDIENRFIEVIEHIPMDGRMIGCADSAEVMKLAAHATAKVESYGLDNGGTRAQNVAYLPHGIEFDLEMSGGVLGRLSVPLYGRHNVLNALAAATVVLSEGVTFDQLVEGTASFKGAFRRFNILTPKDSPITVVDDYAHHPTEVKTTIEAVKLHYPGQRLIVVFRPHTYSRTKTLLADFQHAFGQADVVFITDVESARERQQEASVSGNDVVKGVGEKATFEPDRDKLVEQVMAEAKPGDVILCMTVSGYKKIANELADHVTKS